MRQIRELRPPYNRQGRQLPRVALLRLTTRESYPRLAVTRRLGSLFAIDAAPSAATAGASSGGQPFSAADRFMSV